MCYIACTYVDDGDRMSFKTVVHDKEVHEVCRMFLATLQLVSVHTGPVKCDASVKPGC